MQIHTTIASLRAARALIPSTQTVALVPTMGALHAGHLSLLHAARTQADRVIATLFVNPLQFAPTEDLARYPRTFEADVALLDQAHTDHLFAPTPAEMYPASPASTPATLIDPGPLGDRLDGASRPGHFTGVATVVAKLFHLTQPHLAFFGQKDAAQLSILRAMVRDLNFPIDLIACPIVRDLDGLALSSRNRYLSSAERTAALVLPRTLTHLRTLIEHGERRPATLLTAAHNILAAEPTARLDYLALVDPDTLLPAPVVTPGTLIALAAHFGTTRLIDNLLAP